MSDYVAINVLTVPAEMGAHLEERFSARAGMVEKSEGFRGFQLLRPAEGTDKYFVFTRWESKAAFEKWRDGMGAAAHDAERQQNGPMAASGSELWAFDVVLDVAPSS
ncbi:mycobilin-forming heme oxygenase MhuD [Sporichthya brevicatena]|uniref:Mycobilin-forming heme oxygenase MhuD n=1 Tax=Sporichthya brevicatena TaxID=171442 RepID=A0ABP3RX83_9ACTN